MHLILLVNLLQACFSLYVFSRQFEDSSALGFCSVSKVFICCLSDLVSNLMENNFLFCIAYRQVSVQNSLSNIWRFTRFSCSKSSFAWRVVRGFKIQSLQVGYMHTINLMHKLQLWKIFSFQYPRFCALHKSTSASLACVKVNIVKKRLTLHKLQIISL